MSTSVTSTRGLGPSGGARRVAAEVERYAIAVLALAVCAAAVAAALTRLQRTEHVSEVTMVVRSTGGASTTETAVRTLIGLADSQVVGQALRERTRSTRDVHDIVNGLSVERPPGSAAVTVSYSDPDASRSLATASAVIPVLQDQVARLSTGPAAPTTMLSPDFSLQPWGGGAVVTTDEPAPVLRNAALATLLGVLVGVVLAGLHRQRRPLVASAADAEEATGLPVVTSLGLDGGRGRHRARLHPQDVVDTVVASLPAALGQRGLPHRLLVVGVDHGHQRASFLLRLAHAMARHGTASVLVDADLDSGRLSRHLGLGNAVGIAESVRAGKPSSAAVVTTEDGPAPGTRVLPAGRELPLATTAIGAVLDELGTGARLVVDAPVHSARQSLGELVRGADAVVVLVHARRTVAPDLTSLSDLIRSLGNAPAATVVISDGVDYSTETAAAGSSDGGPHETTTGVATARS